MNAVIDEVERLGAAVERGELDPGEAAHRVQQCSDGGLTLADAADFLRHWKTARANCEELYARAADLLLAIGLRIVEGER